MVVVRSRRVKGGRQNIQAPPRSMLACMVRRQLARWRFCSTSSGGSWPGSMCDCRSGSRAGLSAPGDALFGRMKLVLSVAHMLVLGFGHHEIKNVQLLVSTGTTASRPRSHGPRLGVLHRMWGEGNRQEGQHRQIRARRSQCPAATNTPNEGPQHQALTTHNARRTSRLNKPAFP
jgi:hypothetical protein